MILRYRRHRSHRLFSGRAPACHWRAGLLTISRKVGATISRAVGRIEIREGDIEHFDAMQRVLAGGNVTCHLAAVHSVFIIWVAIIQLVSSEMTGLHLH